MLTKITLDNFKSFKKKTTIDLIKTNYTILPQNVADNGVLKGCIFVGANASGKSTIILGVKLLLDFLFFLLFCRQEVIDGLACYVDAAPDGDLGVAVLAQNITLDVADIYLYAFA